MNRATTSVWRARDLGRISPSPASAAPVIRAADVVPMVAGWDGLLYRHTPSASKPIAITAIPYYAWDNRAAGEMRVWLRLNG